MKHQGSKRSCSWAYARSAARSGSAALTLRGRVPSVAAASKENYSAWKSSRDTLLAQASLPAMSVRTVTSLARTATGEGAEIMAPEADGRARSQIIVEMVERGEMPWRVHSKVDGSVAA